jgi:hypothetical protein
VSSCGERLRVSPGKEVKKKKEERHRKKRTERFTAQSKIINNQKAENKQAHSDARIPAMDAEHLVVDDDAEREVVEQVSEVFPHVRRVVLLVALVVEAVHLRDLPENEKRR